MPPPLLGPVGGMLGWIIWAIGAGLVIALIVVVIEYFARMIAPRTSQEVAQSKELGVAMEELLREIRLLRREIEELRKELRE